MLEVEISKNHHVVVGSRKSEKLLLIKLLKFVEHLYSNNCLDAVELGNTSCNNCLYNIELFIELYKKYFDTNSPDGLQKVLEELESED